MFEDREDAGFKLCPKLKKYSDKKDVILVGLTRGGIVPAKVISSCLHIYLKPLIVKKIGAFKNSEYAIGALVSQSDVFWDKKSLKEFRISRKIKNDLVLQKVKEIESLKAKLKIKISPEEFINKRIILVDDGVATGASVLVALKYFRKYKVKEVILVTPVIALDTFIKIKKYFDRIVCLEKPAYFYAVAQYYKRFEQISDEEVAKILNI